MLFSFLKVTLEHETIMPTYFLTSYTLLARHLTIQLKYQEVNIEKSFFMRDIIIITTIIIIIIFTFIF